MQDQFSPKLIYIDLVKEQCPMEKQGMKQIETFKVEVDLSDPHEESFLKVA